MKIALKYGLLITGGERVIDQLEAGCVFINSMVASDPSLHLAA